MAAVLPGVATKPVEKLAPMSGTRQVKPICSNRLRRSFEMKYLFYFAVVLQPTNRALTHFRGAKSVRNNVPLLALPHYSNALLGNIPVRQL